MKAPGKLTTNGGFVSIQQKLFDHLRQHCERCHDFVGSLEVLPDRRVVWMPPGSPGPVSLKRKASMGLQRPKGSRTKPTPAEAALRWLLRNAPKASDWRMRQIELGLKTAEQYEGVIRAFGNVPNTRVEESYEDVDLGDELVNLAERLALLTKGSLANAKLQRSFALFQALILLSYCLVLRNRGIPPDQIDRIITHIAVNEKDRKKMLKGALWINKAINGLIDNGWTIYRATELFFIDALSLSYLGSIHHQNNASALLDHLRSNEFVDHDYSDCLGPRYTIPGLISSLLSTCAITANEISIEEICKALGYPVDRVSESIQDICIVHASSAAISSAAQDYRIEVLDRRSFESSRSFHNQPQSFTLTRQPILEQEIIDDPVNPTLSNNRNTYHSDQGLREGQQQSKECESFIPYSSHSAALISTTLNSAAPVADDQLVLYSHHDQIERMISGRSRIAPSPSPPQALLIAESSFRNVKLYFENSCRNMRFNDHGILLNSNGTELQNDLCNDFDSYCFTATMFVKRNMPEEFYHALSKASDLVENILRAEHPRTLACFLEVFIHLIQTGLPDVTLALRDFVRRMSAELTVTGHPWGQICQLLGELDAESLDQAMAQIWKCTIDTFESQLGTLGGFVVSVRLDYIKRVYGSTNYIEEERLLRDILSQFQGIPRISTPRVMLNLAHNLNRQGRYDEAEKMAQHILSLFEKEVDMYATKNSERIECKKNISHSQFNQQNVAGAEQTMREAIRMIQNQRGIEHPWVLEFTTVLEGWLRNWGREDDACALREDIGQLIGISKVHPAGGN